MVKLEMDVQGLQDNETDMVNPDFALVAQAMGFTGMTVHHPDDVKKHCSRRLDMMGLSWLIS